MTTTGNTTVGGALTIIGTTNINGNLVLNAVSGSTGQYIRKTGSSTQSWSNIAVGDIASGSANNILITNAAGNTSQWANSINLTSGTLGTLTVSGATNINGNLVLNSNGGSTGQYIRKTSSSSQTWSSILLSDIPAGPTSSLLATGIDGNIGWARIVAIQTLITSSHISTPQINFPQGNLRHYQNMSLESRWNYNSVPVGQEIFAYFDRVGRQVTCQITSMDAITVSPSIFFQFPYTVISAFRPVDQVSTFTPVIVNGIATIGMLTISIGGVINLYSSVTSSNFPNGGTVSIPSICISWISQDS